MPETIEHWSHRILRGSTAGRSITAADGLAFERLGFLCGHPELTRDLVRAARERRALPIDAVEWGARCARLSDLDTRFGRFQQAPADLLQCRWTTVRTRSGTATLVVENQLWARALHHVLTTLGLTPARPADTPPERLLRRCVAPAFLMEPLRCAPGLRTRQEDVEFLPIPDAGGGDVIVRLLML